MVTQNQAVDGGYTPDMQDHRQKPHGVLPRQLQMWLMIGIALVIVAIILVTGRSTPAPRPVRPDRPTLAAAPPTDRIRGYEQQLAQEVARQQQALERETAPAPRTGLPPSAEAGQTDPLAEDQRRRAHPDDARLA